MKRQDDMRAEHKVPTTEDCYMNKKLLDGAYCRTLLDTGASKSYMSMIFT